LRVSEERFRRYFDLGLIGMAITSPSKGCVEVNDELCRMLGYERDELLQKSWVDLTHPDDLAADESQFARVMAGEIDGYTLDKRWIRADGRVMHSIMAAKCVRRDNGTVDSSSGWCKTSPLASSQLNNWPRASGVFACSPNPFRIMSGAFGPIPWPSWSAPRSGTGTGA